jgi:hypothetical protein
MATATDTTPSRRRMLDAGASGAVLAARPAAGAATPPASLLRELANPVQPFAPHAAAGADADLIRACAEHAVNAEAYNRDGLLVEADKDPLWQAYERTRNIISEARPESMAGVLAKARTPCWTRSPPGRRGRWSSSTSWCSSMRCG